MVSNPGVLLHVMHIDDGILRFVPDTHCVLCSFFILKNPVPRFGDGFVLKAAAYRLNRELFDYSIPEQGDVI